MAVLPCEVGSGTKRWRKTSKRYDQPFERSVAIHEVDPLPSNLNAIAPTYEVMQARAAEDALRLSAVFQQLELGADGAGISFCLLDRHVGDDAAGARARLLRVDARARQPPHARLEQAPVVVDQRDGVARAGLVRLRRYPVPGIRREQAEPLVEPPFVEQARLVDEKLLAFGGIRRSAARARVRRCGRVGRRERHGHALASAIAEARVAFDAAPDASPVM